MGCIFICREKGLSTKRSCDFLHLCVSDKTGVKGEPVQLDAVSVLALPCPAPIYPWPRAPSQAPPFPALLPAVWFISFSRSPRGTWRALLAQDCSSRCITAFLDRIQPECPEVFVACN